MSQDTAVEITDLDVCREFGEELLFEEVEARLETLVIAGSCSVFDTDDGTQNCCHLEEQKPNCDRNNERFCDPQ
jgi:hypothetical protein